MLAARCPVHRSADEVACMASMEAPAKGAGRLLLARKGILSHSWAQHCIEVQSNLCQQFDAHAAAARQSGFATLCLRPDMKVPYEKEASSCDAHEAKSGLLWLPGVFSIYG